MDAWETLCLLRQWLEDIKAGDWPRGRVIASRQARHLERKLIPEAERRYNTQADYESAMYGDCDYR